MDKGAFVGKGAAAAGSERAESPSHFDDLCRVLREKTPTEADPSRSFYMFEAKAKSEDENGYADAWHRGKFAWEYKGKGKDLREAYAQLNRYRERLENPPLLVACNFDNYEVHTNWTNTETWIYKFANVDILGDAPVEVVTISGTPAKDARRLSPLRVLKALWENPDELRPGKDDRADHRGCREAVRHDRQGIAQMEG